MKAAAIDLGTNSFLCLIGEGHGGRIENVLSDQVIVTRLGEGVHSQRKFAPQALDRAEKAFQVFRKSIDESGVTVIQATATSAARDVSNGELLFKLGEKYGFPIQIISGDEEAKLTFRGGTSHLSDTRDCAVLDIGGGSTEFIYHDNQDRFTAKSIDVGAVRLTEMFITQHPTPANEVAALTQYAVEKMNAYRFVQPKQLIAVAGTPTALACAILGIDYSSDAVDGYRLKLPVVEMWAKKLAAMTLNERAQLKGVGEKRADIIVAGTVLLLESLKKFQLAEMYVSTRGLRYGLLMNMLR